MDYFFLGDDELVTGFRSIGIHGMGVKDADEAIAVFTQITSGIDTGITLPASLTGNCQVLILTEETASWLGENLIDWQLSGRYPLIVEIPGILGRMEGHKTLVDSIREAIGIHI